MIARRLVFLPFALLLSVTLLAQTPGDQTTAPPEVAALSQGWTLLAQGNASQASRLAENLMAQNPGSAAVLALAVEAELARAGAMAALGTYEHWLGSRTVESGYALRRIARGLLRELALDPQGRSVRSLAADALRADGDAAIVAEIEQAAPAGDPANLGLLSAVGSPQAVDALIATVESPIPNKAAAISGLAKSRSPRAMGPLVGLLGDQNPITRMQAAEALGQIGAAQAIPALKPLLDDPVFPVKFAAARALFALNDPAGAALLRDFQASAQPAIRLGALRATKSQPDAGWLQQVRDLTADPDPEIRRQAAELLGPHDPNAAQAVLEPLLSDANPAAREAASDSYLRYAATDFATLRRALRSTDGPTRVRAADRILQLTR